MKNAALFVGVWEGHKPQAFCDGASDLPEGSGFEHRLEKIGEVSASQEPSSRFPETHRRGLLAPAGLLAPESCGRTSARQP